VIRGPATRPATLEESEQLRRSTIIQHKLGRFQRLDRFRSLDPQTRRRAELADAKLCKRSFIYWCDNYGWVRSEKADQEPVLIDTPFVLWPDQVAFVEWIEARREAGELALVPKSRELGISWLVLHWIYWGWRFRRRAAMIGSRVEDLVDKAGDYRSLFEKLRYVHRLQPAWLKERRIKDGHLILHNLRSNTVIAGESTNPNWGRSGRTGTLFIDEYAAVPKEVARSIRRAIESVSDFILFVYNPESDSEHASHFLYRELPAHRVRVMDWRCDPFRPENFRELKTLPIGNLTAEEFEQAYECSHSAVAKGNLIWTVQGSLAPDATAATRSSVLYEDTDPRWRAFDGPPKNARAARLCIGAWDFGTGPSMLVCLIALLEPPPAGQESTPTRIWVDDELTWYSADWHTAAADVWERHRANGYGQVRVHFGDPSGVQREGDQQSWESHLRGQGIPLMCLPVWNNSEAGREWAIRTAQWMLDSGQILVHQRCIRLRECLRLWKRDIDDFATIDGLDLERVKPRHDQHSHPGMAFTYLVAGAAAYVRTYQRQRAADEAEIRRRAGEEGRIRDPLSASLPIEMERGFSALMRGLR
jgi:hypothetical protein